jgi:hypothetical protein
LDLGEKMFALIEIVNTSSVINSTNCVKRIELYDTRLEADTIAKERNDLISKVIDKVIEDASNRVSYNSILLTQFVELITLDVLTISINANIFSPKSKHIF